MVSELGLVGEILACVRELDSGMAYASKDSVCAFGVIGALLCSHEKR